MERIIDISGTSEDLEKVVKRTMGELREKRYVAIKVEYVSDTRAIVTAKAVQAEKLRHRKETVITVPRGHLNLRGK